MARRRTTGEKLVASAVVKMHLMIGIERSWAEIVAYSLEHPNWYSEHAWPSPEIEAKFRKWLHAKLMKTLHLTELGAQKELEMFMLMWGWSHPAPKDTDG